MLLLLLMMQWLWQQLLLQQQRGWLRVLRRLRGRGWPGALPCAPPSLLCSLPCWQHWPAA